MFVRGRPWQDAELRPALGYWPLESLWEVLEPFELDELTADDDANSWERLKPEINLPAAIAPLSNCSRRTTF